MPLIIGTNGSILSQMHVAVVATLPTTGSDKKIYLIATDTPNEYEQWIWQDNQWMRVGTAVLTIDELSERMGFFTCTTGESVQTKIVSAADAPNYILVNGGAIKIKFTHKNTYVPTEGNPVSLQIGTAQSAPLYYDGSAVSATNTWEDDETVECYYDGQYYQANNVSGGGTFATGQRVKNVGIDNEPIAGSDNLVKSGSVEKIKYNDYINSSIVFDKNNAYLQLHHIGGESEYSEIGDKYSWIYPVSAGATIEAKCTYGKGAFCSVYRTVEGALKGIVSDRLQLISGYTTDEIFGTVTVDGYLRIGASALDGEYISDVSDVIAETTIKLFGNNSLQRVSSFPLILTSGTFNANNETRKFEIPNFRISVNGELHLIQEQEIPYDFDLRTWWFLIVSTDYSTVSIIHYSELNKSNRDRIIAFFITKNEGIGISSISTIPEWYIVSYFEGSQNVIWTVDSNKPDNIIRNIDNKIGKIRGVYDTDYNWRVPIVNDTFDVRLEDNLNGVRLRLIYRVLSGDRLSIKTTWSLGFLAIVTNSLAEASLSVSSLAIQKITATYSTDEINNIKIIKDGYLAISLKSEGDTPITDEMKIAMMNSLTIKLLSGNTGTINQLIKDTEGLKLSKYPLPEFLENTIASISGNAKNIPGLEDAPRACIKDCVVLPFSGCKLYVKIPKEYLMGFRFYNGYNNTDAAYGGAWLKDGESITPDIKYTHFMCYVCHTLDGITADNTYTFETGEINKLLENGDLGVFYENISGSVINRLLESGKQLKSTMIRYSSDKSKNIQGAMPTIVHCSDIHGDAIRWRNVVELASYIKATMVVNTGDSVAYHIDNGISYLPYVVKDFDNNIPIISVIGNHDTNGEQEYRANLNTNLYNKVIKPFEVSGGYILPSSLDYEDAPTYYYRDFTTQNLRVITLNLYDKNQLDWNSNALSQKQINWFITTLKNTPSNYGVIINYHRSCGGVVKDANYTKFWQESSTAGYSPSTWKLSGIIGNPILEIIDAFIAKTSLESSFTQSVVGGTETIYINADFTNVNSGVEFIAHLFGHHHRDTVGYYDSVEKQLCLCICPTTSAYSNIYTSWANPSDLPRFGGGKEQDAFNVYTIDREKKTVRIAKFGSTLNSETLQQRDYMVIPYKE